MSISTLEKVLLGIGLTGFGGIFICLGGFIHIAYTKMDEMLEYMKNSPFVMNRARLLGMGMGGRLFVLGGIIGVLIMPRVYIRDGGASADDLQNFPATLKRRLLILHWSMLPFLVIVFVLWMLIKFEVI